MSTQREPQDIRMNAAGLYREEIVTDRRVGTIRLLIPIKPDGLDDPTRTRVFEGQMSLLTSVGSLPVSFEIEAQTLAAAVERFSAAAQAAVEETLKELEALRREAASSIVLPGQSGGLGLGNLGGLKGMPPGSGFRRP